MARNVCHNKKRLFRAINSHFYNKMHTEHLTNKRRQKKIISIKQNIINTEEKLRNKIKTASYTKYLTMGFLLIQG